MIRPVRHDDADAIAAIYNHYILHSIITFEEAIVDGNELRKRIDSITQKHPWIVSTENEKVTGYAYCGDWNKRSAYRFTAEVTVYLHPEHTGKGLGTLLYEHLLRHLKEHGYHSAIGGISLPNPASVALHEKLGFKKAAHYKEVGFKFGKWIDVGYWQFVIRDS